MIQGLDSLLDDYKPNKAEWDTAWDVHSITDYFGTAGSVTVELTPELIEIHAAMAFAAQLMNDFLPPEHYNMGNTGDENPWHQGEDEFDTIANLQECIEHLRSYARLNRYLWQEIRRTFSEVPQGAVICAKDDSFVVAWPQTS